jgi:glycosyltransferase involved in cell wall biosynthesis
MLDIQPAKNIYYKSYKENIDNNNQLTIGSISRAEKISSEKYNNFIYKLLDSQPTLTYLYTGEQSSISLIPERIRSHTRAESLGWVDPFTSISRFTIYLEPFPWGGGEMTFLALEHGLPYLILETKESLEVGIYGQIKCIAQDRDPILQFSFCGSISELNERIDKLVKNPELRFKLGQAWRQTFMDYQPQLMNHWRDLFNE